MTVWGDIIASSERFAPIGERHDLQLSTNLVPKDGEVEDGPILAIEVHSEELDLVMEREMPAREGASWIDVLVMILDVPTQELPHPQDWAIIVDRVLEHRREMEDLPVLDEEPDVGEPG